MDRRFIRNDIKRKMKRLGLEDESAKYIAAAIVYCLDIELDPLDIVLSKNIYPNLERLYKKSPDAIESVIRRDIVKAWEKTEWFRWRDELDYNSRPTVKKLLTILLKQIREGR